MGLLLRVSLALAALLALLQATLAPASASSLACGVCEAIVDEVEKGILATPSQHLVQTRFRVDEKRRVPYARTEHNLLEILESSSFTRKFDAYGVVKPHSRSSRLLKQAFEQAAAKGTEVEAEVNDSDKPAEATAEIIPEAAAAVESENAPVDAAPADTPAAPETPVTATEGETVAAGTPTDTLAAAAAAAAVPPPEINTPGGSFRAKGPLPLSLEYNQPHLILMSHVRGSNLAADKSEDARADIQVAVGHFLEEHLEEALVLFHRDEPDIKRKLCGEVTRSCRPNQRKKGGKGKESKGKGKKANKTKAAPATPATPAAEAAPAAAAPEVATPAPKEEL